MKKIAGIFLLLFLTALHAATEEGTPPNSADTAPAINETQKKPAASPRENIMDNLFFGGAIHLSLGNYTVLGIEPMLGYHFSPKISAGVTARYDYINDSRYDPTRKTSQYGGSVFGRYRVTDNFYAQVESATYNHERFYTTGNSAGREWVPYLFMGGGYRQPLGEKSWFYAQVLFDLLQDDKSPYDDWTPFLSLGVGTGF